MIEAKPTIEDQAINFWVKYFCVCGEPERAVEEFREIMGMFDDATADGRPFINGDKRDAYAIKHGQGLMLCILYWLEGMGLAEHGTGANWSWLTPLGEHVRNEIMNGTPEFFREADRG
jgi:hypothetical protein